MAFYYRTIPMHKNFLGVCLALAPIAAISASGSVYAPLILLSEAEKVVACGSMVQLTENEGSQAELRIFVERDAADRSKTVMLVRVRSARGTAEARVRSARLGAGELAHGTLQKVSGPGAEVFRAEGYQSGAEQGELFRALMLTGGSLDVVLDNGKHLTFHMTGPAPVTVFRSYLACTGDLYGPIQ